MNSIKRIRAFTFVLLTSLCIPLFAGKIEDAAFAGECAMGLVEGQHIRTDCEVQWNGPDNTLYCFRSEDAKNEFSQDSERNIQRAMEFYAVSDIKKTADHMGHYTSKDVKKFVTTHIEDQMTANEGTFQLRDAVLGKDVKLVYEEVDLVRTLMGYGYFPSVKFHLAEDEQKRYLIDFWVRPQHGELAILDTRIYKAPRLHKGKWTPWMREPRPWWWIPASEHPGATEEKRAWEVISAIENQIISDKDTEGQFQLVDDKTQEKIDLEFIGVHMPVRRLTEDGRYFACSDFRKIGSQDEYYDIDFWLDDDDGSIEVGDVRVHKVPEMKDGGFIQIPRYNFDDLEYEMIP
ncbi:MAG: hypothetical protein V3U76_05580 [Granulosicoccus sp.]